MISVSSSQDIIGSCLFFFLGCEAEQSKALWTLAVQAVPSVVVQWSIQKTWYSFLWSILFTLELNIKVFLRPRAIQDWYRNDRQLGISSSRNDALYLTVAEHPDWCSPYKWHDLSALGEKDNNHLMKDFYIWFSAERGRYQIEKCVHHPFLEIHWTFTLKMSVFFFH